MSFTRHYIYVTIMLLLNEVICKSATNKTMRWVAMSYIQLYYIIYLFLIDSGLQIGQDRVRF